MVLAWQSSSLRRRVRAARVAGGQGRAELAATAVAAEGRGAGSAHIDEGGVAEEDALAEEEEPQAPRAHWAVELLRPRPGEDLFAYRDRVLPLAQAVVAPQRMRVANKRRTQEVWPRLRPAAAAALASDLLAAVVAADRPSRCRGRSASGSRRQVRRGHEVGAGAGDGGRVHGVGPPEDLDARDLLGGDGDDL